jgi:hypothetical protein
MFLAGAAIVVAYGWPGTEPPRGQGILEWDRFDNEKLSQGILKSQSESSIAVCKKACWDNGECRGFNYEDGTCQLYSASEPRLQDQLGCTVYIPFRSMKLEHVHAREHSKRSRVYKIAIANIDLQIQQITAALGRAPENVEGESLTAQLQLATAQKGRMESRLASHEENPSASARR